MHDSSHPLAFSPDQWPDPLPVFPLRGVILLREIPLPLNIFEERYLHLMLDALRGDRIVGMVQSASAGAGALDGVGCAGRIVQYAETGDGRLSVTLQGLARFRVAREAEGQRGYRRVVADWRPFAGDLEKPEAMALDLDALRSAMRGFLDARGVSVDWESIEGVPGSLVVDYLSCHLPFSPEEKQALLEAPDHARRLALLRGLAGMENQAMAASGARH